MPGLKHMNVDALSRNQPWMMMTSMKKYRTLGVHKLTYLGQKMRSTLFRLARVRNGFVLGDKKKSFFQHHECCFGINHWRYAKNH